MRGNQANTNDSEDDAGGAGRQDSDLQEGLDYYVENGLFVFTATFLLKRSYCCESGCRNCPYQNSEPQR